MIGTGSREGRLEQPWHQALAAGIAARLRGLPPPGPASRRAACQGSTLGGMSSLAEGFARWPVGEDALADAVECVILAHWTPGQPIADRDIAELWRVYAELTGWEPTEAEKLAAQPID